LTPEEQLATLMEAVVGDLAPPLGEILAKAERRGRRLKRRRRVALAIGAMGVVALCAVGVDVGLRFAGSHAIGVAGEETAPPGIRIAGSPSATTGSRTQEATSGRLPIDGSAEILILHTLLPTSWSFSDPQEPETANLWITMNDGKGPFSVFVAVRSTADSGMDPVDCAAQGLPSLAVAALAAQGALHEGCVVQTFSNGDKAMEEAVGAVQVGGYYQYRIIVSRADGVAVEIEAGDGISQSGKTTRIAPPLSLMQWTQIARNQLWQLEVTPAAETFK
jgi:hypothetical protein